MTRTAAFLPDVLADAFRGLRGFQVETHPHWDTRGRATGFDPFHPDHGGILNHHTGRGSFDALLRYMAETSRIAPLCHWSTSRPRNGTVRIVIVAAGRANHAGRGGAGKEGTWWVPTDHGNTYLIGGEHQNDGTQPWPGQQNEAIHIGSAAILAHLSHDETRAIDHKNYAPHRKVDRHSVRLAREQAAIARHLATPHAQEDPMTADPRGTARICMREYLGRSPHGDTIEEAYAELNFHADQITELGLNGYIEWLETQQEAQDWAEKIGAEVRSPDRT